MTLIELLVVIVIITTIVAAAIPLLSPSNDDRRLREATRGLNTYITGAQARAISTHRPCGVAFKRVGADTNKNGQKPDDNGVCMEVYYVEQQPPYAGFDVNSRACVAIHPDQQNWAGYVLVRFVTRGTTTAGLPVGWGVDQFPSGMIRPGDVIEINGTQFELLFVNNEPRHNIQLDAVSNTYFETQSANQPPQILARPLNDSGQQINPKYDDNGYELPTQPTRSPYWTSAAPYKVLRQPTPASDEPYQLPEGTAIDLRASGVGINDYFYVQNIHDNNQGILIMFAPEGRVSRVSFSQEPNNSAAFDQAVVDNIYLLVGRRDKTPPDAGSDPTLDSNEWSKATTDEARAKLREPLNWLSGASRWVVIGSQSGRIATIENAFVNADTIAANGALDETTRNSQILAAREFTHEMGQLGGR